MARRKLSAYRLAGLLVLATALTPPGAGLHYSAVAQEGVLPEPPADDQGPMLLSANELVYNHDTQHVWRELWRFWSKHHPPCPSPLRYFYPLAQSP